LTNAVSGPGWLLQHSAHLAGTYTTLAEVQDVKGPPAILEHDEVTNQSSPNAYKEFITTVIDGGEVTFQANFIPGDATQNSTTGLLAWLQGRGIQDWQIVPPAPNAAHTILFTAYVTKWEPNFPVAKHADLSITLKVTGPVTVN
jgi:hypothetical protein